MISITYCSRNDNHGGQLVPRIQAAFDALGEYHAQFGLDVEVIFVEWNPDHPPRLRDVLKEPRGVPVRWYEVPMDIHRGFPNWQKFALWNHIGTNVGHRRARGDWVLCTTHDIIFSAEMAELLSREPFDEDHFYRATRIDGHTSLMPGQSTASRIAQMVKEPVRVNAHGGRGMFTKACGDFILMSREGYHAIRGYTEWPINGMYFDGLLMYRAHALGMRQAILDPPVYHIEHADRGAAVFKSLPHLNHNVYKKMCSRMVKAGQPIEVNTDGWGLGKLKEVQVTDNAWVLTGDYQHPLLPRFW
jgi:hypothetical protein